MKEDLSLMSLTSSSACRSLSISFFPTLNTNCLLLQSCTHGTCLLPSPLGSEAFQKASLFPVGFVSHYPIAWINHRLNNLDILNFKVLGPIAPSPTYWVWWDMGKERESGRVCLRIDHVRELKPEAQVVSLREEKTDVHQTTRWIEVAH